MSELLQNLTQLIYANGGAANLSRLINKEWQGFPKQRRIRYNYVVDGNILRKHWHNMSLPELSKLTGAPAPDLSKQGRAMGLPYKPHVFRKQPNQRDYSFFDIVNMETGIFYGNMKEVAKVAGVPKRTMQGYLSGERKNKTNFIILGKAVK